MRIRTIKPEYWQDEKLAPLPPIDRLVFLGLISMADDAGRLVDNVKAIDGFLFGETDDTARPSVETLVALGRVQRYVSASGQRLLQIVGWRRHQKVDNPSRYTLPAPVDEEPTTSTKPAALAPPAVDGVALVLPGSSEAVAPVSPTSDTPAADTLDQSSRDRSETGATSSLSDQLPATTDQRSPTSERAIPVRATGSRDAAAPPARSVGLLERHTSRLPADRSPAENAFLSHFYAGAAPARRDEIDRQLVAVMTPAGCPDDQGRTARLEDPAQRDALLDRVRGARRAMEKPDAAVVVFLRKAAEPRQTPDAVRAAHSEDRVERQRQAKAQQAVTARAAAAEDDARRAQDAQRGASWALAHPDADRRLVAKVDADVAKLPATMAPAARAEFRESLLATERRAAADRAARAPPAAPMAATG